MSEFTDRGRALSIVEARMGYAQHRSTGWEDGSREINLILSVNSLVASRQELLINSESLALVSHHAVARFYERMRYRRDIEGQLQADIAAIFENCKRVLDDALAGPKAFFIAVPSEGEFCGEVINIRNEDTKQRITLLDCRTFLSADMVSECKSRHFKHAAA